MKKKLKLSSNLRSEFFSSYLLIEIERMLLVKMTRAAHFFLFTLNRATLSGEYGEQSTKSSPINFSSHDSKIQTAMYGHIENHLICYMARYLLPSSSTHFLLCSIFISYLPAFFLCK
jgi:hypothetical protein